MGCSNDEKILKIAKQYVAENIIPLFPNDNIEIMKDKEFHQIRFIKKPIEQIKLITSNETLETDIKFQNFQRKQTLSEKDKINIAVLKSVMEALKEADCKTGFYYVFIQTHNGESPYIWNVVISKDLRVLNKIDKTTLEE